MDQFGPDVTHIFEFNEIVGQRRDLVMDELTEYLINNAEDGFWSQIQSEARREVEREPALVSFLFASVLRHSKLEDALCVILANKLQTPELSAILLRDLSNDALTEDVTIRASTRADLLAAQTRDPAAHGYLLPFLYYKGFHALQAYRVAPLAVGEGAADLGRTLPESHFGGIWSRRPSCGSDRFRDITRPRHEHRHRRDGNCGRQRITAA